MKDLKSLREEIMEYKLKVNQSFEEVKVEILLRAYKEDLTIQETRIVDKLKDMIMQILGQFSNKEDTDKKFTILTKKLREVMELIQKLQESVKTSEDAMLSKKPIRNSTCGSCEKNLINMHASRYRMKRHRM